MTPTEKKVFNYWVWLFILGPAAFFIYYLLFPGGAGLVPGKKAEIPQDYREAGVAAAVGKGTLTAAPEGKVYYAEKIVINNNTIVPEVGTVFAVVPLIAPEGFGDPDRSQWYVVGADGSRYDLLKAVKDNPAAAGAPGGANNFLIFKIGSTPQDNYLVYSAANSGAAWKLPPRAN